MAFDPYQTWLGVSAAGGIPDHYRLLGLKPFEQDRERIQRAAAERTRRVNMYKSEQPKLVQAVLFNVNAARICLLNPMRKTDYDRWLEGQAGDAAPASMDATAQGPAGKPVTATPAAARPAAGKAAAKPTGRPAARSPRANPAKIDPALEALLDDPLGEGLGDLAALFGADAESEGNGSAGSSQAPASGKTAGDAKPAAGAKRSAAAKPPAGKPPAGKSPAGKSPANKSAAKPISGKSAAKPAGGTAAHPVHGASAKTKAETKALPNDLLPEDLGDLAALFGDDQGSADQVPASPPSTTTFSAAAKPAAASKKAAGAKAATAPRGTSAAQASSEAKIPAAPQTSASAQPAALEVGEAEPAASEPEEPAETGSAEQSDAAVVNPVIKSPQEPGEVEFEVLSSEDHSDMFAAMAPADTTPAADVAPPEAEAELPEIGAEVEPDLFADAAERLFETEPDPFAADSSPVGADESSAGLDDDPETETAVAIETRTAPKATSGGATRGVQARRKAADPLLKLIPPDAGYDVIPLDGEAKTLAPQRHRRSAADVTLEPGEEEELQQVAVAESAGGWPHKWWLTGGAVAVGLLLLAGGGGGYFFMMSSGGDSSALEARRLAALTRRHTQPAAAAKPAPANAAPAVAMPNSPAGAAETWPPTGDRLAEVDRSSPPAAGSVAMALADAWWAMSRTSRGPGATWAQSQAGRWWEAAHVAGSADADRPEWAGRRAIIEDLESGPPPSADSAWGQRLGWPVLFQDELTQPAATAGLHASLGQFGGDAVCEPGRGLRIRGGQSATALWLRHPVSDHFHATLWFALGDEGSLCLWLGGPGHGNSPALGYCLMVTAGRVELLRKGAGVASAEIAELKLHDVLHKVSVLRDAGRFVVWINGQLALSYEDRQPLGPPLHAWLGLGAVAGQGASGVRCRDMAVRGAPLSEGDEMLAHLTVSPRPTAAPSPNKKLLLRTAPSEFVGWYQSQPDNVVQVDRRRLLLCGAAGGAPALVCRTPLEGSFAFEVEFEYVPPVLPRPVFDLQRPAAENYLRSGGEELNFRLLLMFQPKPPEPEQFESFQPGLPAAWELALPAGNGLNALSWVNAAGQQVIQQTPYYTPAAGRTFTVRLERQGPQVRAFLNGSLLLEATQPEGLPDPALPAFVGLRQLFGGVVVHQAAVWRIGE